MKDADLHYRVEETLRKLKENGVAGECASIEALREFATFLLIATFDGAKFNKKDSPGRIDIKKFYRNNIVTGDLIRVLLQMILGIDDIVPGVKSMAIARRYLPIGHEMWKRLKPFDPNVPYEELQTKYLSYLWGSGELSKIV